MSSNPTTQESPATQSGDAVTGKRISALEIDLRLKSIIADVLGIAPEDAADLTPDTGLFGHLPELDSMAVAGLLTEIEDRLGIVIEDDDVDGEMLETYGGLLTFVETKIAGDQSGD